MSKFLLLYDGQDPSRRGVAPSLRRLDRRGALDIVELTKAREVARPIDLAKSRGRLERLATHPRST